MNAVDILKYGHLTLQQAINSFPQAALEQEGACGVWSVKDIVAHLESYELVLVDILSSFSGNTPTPALDKFVAMGNQFNDAEVNRRKERTITEALEELNAAHALSMSLVAAIPEETRRQTGTLPWYGMDYALDDVIVYMYYGHKREHSAQIAAFHDRVG